MLVMSLTRKKLRHGRASPWLVLPVVVALACVPQPGTLEKSEEASGSRDADVAAVSSLLEKYVHSINEADTEVAGDVWLTSDPVSFISPIGHQVGWESIVQNFYERAMRDSFSQRKLTLHDIAVNVFGDTAVAKFEWVFDATKREDGSAIQTKGRESQVYTRTDDGRWRLVHVHYSE